MRWRAATSGGPPGCAVQLSCRCVRCFRWWRCYALSTTDSVAQLRPLHVLHGGLAAHLAGGPGVGQNLVGGAARALAEVDGGGQALLDAADVVGALADGGVHVQDVAGRVRSGRGQAEHDDQRQRDAGQAEELLQDRLL